ncbi:MAG: sugar transferase [Anaerolineales bacterium]|nr:sugar transferase [Anaerolineales bacterium]
MTLLASDSLMLALAFRLAFWLRFELQLTLSPEIVPSPDFYPLVVFILIPVWLGIFAFFKLYDYDHLLGGTGEYASVFNGCTVGMMLVITTAFVEPALVVSRAWLLMAWVLSFFLVAAARFWIRRGVYRLRRKGYFVVPGLIVGANEEAQALAQQLRSWTTSGVNVLGFVSDTAPVGQVVAHGLPALGGFAELPNLIQHHEIEELVVANSAVNGDELLELFRHYGVDGKVNLRISSGLFDVFTTGLTIKSLAYVPLISAEKVRLSRIETAMKTCLDYVGATVGLVLLSPVFAVIAILVKLDSPGRAIYNRRVLGRGGQVFDAYKFRSMVVDGDGLLTPEQWTDLQTTQKLKDDPRITRVGHVLRKYSLDELPQLVNVLKGQMSLIGPRMITPAEQEKYGKWDLNLLTVKPGLSGLWQVSGRSDVDYEERVRMDMHYIRNYTIWLDLQLILRTIGTVIRGRGAY